MKQKKYVTVSTPAGESTLFSLKLGNDGSAYVMLKSAQTYYHKENLFDPCIDQQLRALHGEKIDSQKYSVHPHSENKEFFTIKHTLQFQNSEFSTFNSQILLNLGFSTPLFFKTCPDLANPRYLVKESVERERIAEYEPRKHKFVFGVFVTAQQVFNPVMPNPRVKQDIVDIGQFRFAVVSTLFRGPSSRFGDLIHCYNGALSEGNGQRYGVDKPGAGVDAMGAMNFTIETFDKMYRLHC